MMAAVGAQAVGTPNFVLMMSDDTGWGDMGYNGGAAHTPNLDAWSAAGSAIRHVIRKAVTRRPAALYNIRICIIRLNIRMSSNPLRVYSILAVTIARVRQASVITPRRLGITSRRNVTAAPCRTHLEKQKRFDRFYSGSPICSPTRSSFLTGRTPWRDCIFGVEYKALSTSETAHLTVAAAAKSKGYRTFHGGKWSAPPTNVI